jgi:cytochrome P450
VTGQVVGTTATTLDVDPYAPEHLLEPYPVQEAIRETGPVVWLSRYLVFATGRHALVQQVLSDWETYSSESGVGIYNFKKTDAEQPHLAADPEHDLKTAVRRRSPLVELDPPEHDLNRSVLKRVVSPTALRRLREPFARTAEQLVDHLLELGDFDAIPALAEAFPLSVLPDAVGMQRDGRENLLPFSALTFNSWGPPNEIYRNSVANAGPVVEWGLRQANRDVLAPDGLGADIYKAVDSGEITEDVAGRLVRAFVGAGLDTTVNGLSAAILAFTRFPDQWDELRADPSLTKVVFDEVIRWDSPIQRYFRTTVRDTELGGVPIPAGNKVMLSIGAANRDPRKWEDPARFDLRRTSLGHVAFGHGVHSCIGQMVARLESEVLFDALVKRVKRIQPIGEPVHKVNNSLRSMASLPVRLIS